MLHYYLNLPKDNINININDNINLSYAIMKTAIKSFDPFEKYLQNTINAMDKKEIIANWVPIKTENIAELKIIGKLYEIPKKQIIEIESNLNLNTGDRIIGSICGDHKIVSVNKREIVLEPEVKENELLFYNGEKIEYNIKKIQLPKGKIIIPDDPERYIIYSLEQLNGFQEIKYVVNYIDFENIYFENGDKLEAEQSEDLKIVLKDDKDFERIVVSKGIKFTLSKINKNKRDAWWIQLSEIENDNQGDELSGLSPLRYFFDDDITIVDGYDDKIEYRIDCGIEQEYKLVLKPRNPKKDGDFCHPIGKTIKVKANTYSLRMQKNAIIALKRMPVDEHKNLIKLFEKKYDPVERKGARWEKPVIDTSIPNEWFVLEEQRSGATEQRNFVRQALATPDFAILEGPPGSGKTTVILELICQLAKEGKRVLLCGSTHVAIDNILERLKDNNKKLLNEFEILPIRIGDSSRISEDIKEFQIDNMITNNNIPENAIELLLDSANLVCGTTIGILQHPKFKERNKNRNWERYPVIPEFDYLIIDESSKTTFQEFLVPALYAKKWILVGDCLQLAPYTERDEIVSNIEELPLVSKSLQNAVFYLHKLPDLLRHSKENRFIFPVSKEEITEIKKEIKAGRNNDILIEFITEKNMNTINTLKLTVYRIIFVDINILKQVLTKLPETHAVLRDPLRNQNWNKTSHAFSHYAYYENNGFYYNEKGQEFRGNKPVIKRINEYFNEKNWAEEIAWRIEREHQLRLVEKNKTKDNYTKVIKELIPLSLGEDKVEPNLNMVAFMAFPSILESLIQGIKGRKVKIESTISEGFNEEELKHRRTKLRYQHRMHSEISRFPRINFYKGDALQNLESPEKIDNLRNWKYKEYLYRSFWVNVEGETIYNKNILEVKELMNHLKKFVEWAKNEPHPENKEGEKKKNWTVACLTFYRGQEKALRQELQKYTGKERGVSNFDIKTGNDNTAGINIKLHTVDKFQGHEADIVFLSMVQTKRVGFMDNPNRLNVAITRAKFQLVIIGKKEYFLNQDNSEYLKYLASDERRLNYENHSN